MKPSEFRALREIEAQNKTQQTTGEPSAVTEESADKPKLKKEKSILDDNVQSMRKEGFFQSNVKLITFIVCMAIFLGSAIIIPLVHFYGERTVVKGEISMQLDDIIAIAGKKQYISWKDFENYVHTDYSSGSTREHMYVISGTQYVVMVSGPKSDKNYPDTVIICDLNNTSYFIDLTVDNIQLFLSGASSTPTKYINLKDVKEFVDIAIYLRWSDFSDYKYTEKTEASPDKQSMYIIRMYAMEDADFSLWVYGQKVVGAPEKIILVDNLDHNNFVDLSDEEAATKFIEKNILNK